MCLFDGLLLIQTHKFSQSHVKLCQIVKRVLDDCVAAAQ